MKSVLWAFVLFFGSISVWGADGQTAISSKKLKIYQSSLKPVGRQSMAEEDKFSFKPYSPWRLTYFNWATQNLADTNEGVGQLSMYNFVSVDYRLGKDSKVSMRPTFYIRSAGNNFFGEYEGDDINMGDIYFQYARYNMHLLKDDIGLNGSFRLYLPTSEYGKRTSMLYQVRAKFRFFRPWSARFETDYVLEPKLFFYRNRGYVEDFYQRGNKWGELLHYFEFVERVGYKWGFKQSLGMKHQWTYDVPSAGIDSRIKEFLETKFYVFFDIDPVSISAGLQNSQYLRGGRAPRKEIDITRAEDTQYSVMTYVRF